MTPSGKPSTAAAALAAWVQEAADSLARALQARQLPRDQRLRARRALAEAFDALENDAATADLLRRLERFLPRPEPLLARWPDPLAHRRFRPRPFPRMGGPTIRGAVDQRLVERCLESWRFHDRITARLQRVLDTFRTRQAPLQQAETRISALAGEIDLPLTRG